MMIHLKFDANFVVCQNQTKVNFVFKHILKVSIVPKDVLFSYSHVDCRYKSDKCIMVLKLIVSPVFSDLGITAPPPASLNVY